MPRCKLCAGEGELVESHIYPKALAREVGGNRDPPRVFYASPKRHPKRLLTGWYDRIVCGACEARFAQWDDYGIRFVRSPMLDDRFWPSKDRARAYYWHDADPVRLRLFVLSLLWRASVSSLEAFAKVQLGRRADDLRRLLLASDPGDPDDFAVVLSWPLNRPSKSMMLPPIPDRLRSSEGMLRMYRLYFSGFHFLVKTDKRIFPQEIRLVQLRANAPVVALVGEFTKTAEARMIARFLVQSGWKPSKSN